MAAIVLSSEQVQPAFRKRIKQLVEGFAQAPGFLFGVHPRGQGANRQSGTQNFKSFLLVKTVNKFRKERDSIQLGEQHIYGKTDAQELRNLLKAYGKFARGGKSGFTRSGLEKTFGVVTDNGGARRLQSLPHCG